MYLNIVTTSNLAIYEQIVNQIRDCIIRKELLPGDALPSIRSLAKDLQISVITTKRAYEELEKEGLIESVAQKGFYVKVHNPAVVKEKQTVLIEERFSSVLKDAKLAGLSMKDIQDMISVLYETMD